MVGITLKYVTLELIEKIIRLQNYINKHSYNNRKNSNEAVIKIFEKAISSLLINLEKLIKEINELDKESTPIEIYSVQRGLSTCYSAIKDLHKELHVLNTDWLKLETYTFVEQIYKKHINGNESQDLNVILSDDYTFVETNMDTRFERIMQSFFDTQNSYAPEDSPTVIIPKIEYSNPLNWTILVHELGHLDTKKIKKLCESPELFPEGLNIGEKDKLTNWAEEIYCDILAIDIIGPAYFLSLASHALLQSLITGLEVSTNHHPPFAMRLALLHAYIDKNSQNLLTKLPTGEKDSIHSFIYDMTSIINENVKQITDPTENEPLIENLMDYYFYLNEELVEKGTINKEIGSIFELVEKLRIKVPIGGYRSTNGDKNLLKQLNKKGLTTEEFSVIRNSLSERNTELWEIINAGWLFKMNEFIPFGLKLFFDNSTKNIHEKLNDYREKLDLLDDRLLVSIETSKLIDIIEN